MSAQSLGAAGLFERIRDVQPEPHGICSSRHCAVLLAKRWKRACPFQVVGALDMPASEAFQTRAHQVPSAFGYTVKLIVSASTLMTTMRLVVADWRLVCQARQGS